MTSAYHSVTGFMNVDGTGARFKNNDHLD
jgi:hypothetical protein